MEDISSLLLKASFTTCVLDPTGLDFLRTLVYPLFLLFCTFGLSLSPDSSLSTLKCSSVPSFKKIPPLISHFNVSLPLEPISLSELFKLTASSSLFLFSPHHRISAPHCHHSTDIDICLPSVCLQDPLTSTFIPNLAGSFQSLSNLTSTGLDSAHHNYLLGWLLDSLSTKLLCETPNCQPHAVSGPWITCSA